MRRTLHRLLRPIAEIREDEATNAVLMFVYAFLAMTAYNIIQPLTRSTLISSLGAVNIPYVTLGAGFVVGGLMLLYTRAYSVLPRRWALPITQVAMAAMMVVFWALFAIGSEWVAVGFYVWGLILGILLISQFWTLANAVYDPRQAKRLFGLIGGGVTLGGAVGAGLTTLFVKTLGTNTMLLVSAATLLACAAIVATIVGRERAAAHAGTGIEEERGVGMGRAFQLLRHSRQVKLIAIIIAFGSLGAALIDQQVNMAAEAFRSQEEAIASFLASIRVWISVAGFVIQVWLTPRIHRYLGIGFALMILPTNLAVTAIAIFVTQALWAPATATILDRSLRYTVDKTTREVLFLPLPTELRQDVKPFVDVTVDRMARGLAAVLLLVLIQPWGLQLEWHRLSIVSLLLALVWYGMAYWAKQGYLQAFRESIERREVKPTDVRLPVADLSTIEALMSELAEPDERRVLYAIDVLESLDKRNLVTPLLLYHESPAVRARALRALGSAPRDQARKWRTHVRRLLGDESVKVRTAAVAALANILEESDTDLLRPYLVDENPRIAATAAVVLAKSPRPEDVAATEATFNRLVNDPTKRSVARREVALSLRQVPNPRLKTLLVPLLADSNPVVAEEAMRTVQVVGRSDFIFVPTLVAQLRNRRLKSAAREVLVGYGEDVVDALSFFLNDPGENIWVRRHIPATLARIPSQKSMDALVNALGQARDGFLRYKLVSAIDRLRREVPHLTFDVKPLQDLVLREGNRYYEYLSLYFNLFERASMPQDTLLAPALREKAARSRNRVFILLGLIYPWRDIAAARWALEHGDSRARASASEYLDNLLSGPFRTRLMPLLEDQPIEERVRKGNVLLKTRVRDVEETLLQLINDEDELVAASAIDFAGRHKIVALIDDMEHVLAHRDVNDWHVFEAASWVLAGFRLADAQRRSEWLEPLPTTELSARLRETPIFSQVTIDELFRMARTGRQLRYEPGHVIFQEGSVPSDLHLLLDGRAVLSSTQAETREVIAPAPLGIEEVLEGRPMAETARTLDTSISLQLTLEEARTLLADNTDLVQGLFQWAIDHPAFQNSRIVLRAEGGIPKLAQPPSEALRPIDKVLVLQRVSLLARVPVSERLALASVAREERLTVGDTLVRPGDPPSSLLILQGEVIIKGDEAEPIVAAPGDAVGMFETLAGIPLGRTIEVTSPGRALRIDHEDLFDLLSQRPKLLQYVFTTLFGARRAEWGATTAELETRPPSGPDSIRELIVSADE